MEVQKYIFGNNGLMGLVLIIRRICLHDVFHLGNGSGSIQEEQLCQFRYCLWVWVSKLDISVLPPSLSLSPSQAGAKLLINRYFSASVSKGGGRERETEGRNGEKRKEAKMKYTAVRESGIDVQQNIYIYIIFLKHNKIISLTQQDAKFWTLNHIFPL